MRHMDGVRSSEVEAPGGKRHECLGELIKDKRSEELGQDEGAGQVGVLGVKLIELKQALQPFEQDLDLPSEPVEMESLLGRKDVRVEGRNNNNVGSHLESCGRTFSLAS